MADVGREMSWSWGLVLLCHGGGCGMLDMDTLLHLHLLLLQAVVIMSRSGSNLGCAEGGLRHLLVLLLRLLLLGLRHVELVIASLLLGVLLLISHMMLVLLLLMLLLLLLLVLQLRMRLLLYLLLLLLLLLLLSLLSLLNLLGLLGLLGLLDLLSLLDHMRTLCHMVLVLSGSHCIESRPTHSYLSLSLSRSLTTSTSRSSRRCDTINLSNSRRSDTSHRRRLCHCHLSCHLSRIRWRIHRGRPLRHNRASKL